jgi:hypothetical protein
VTTPIARSIGQQLADLGAFVQRELQPQSPEGLFALHVFEAAGEAGPVSGWPDAPSTADLTTGRAPLLAAAGYALTHRDASRPAGVIDAWRAGLDRLSAREPFPADRQTFVYRPVELYGLCLGAQRLLAADDPRGLWLRDVVRRLEAEAPQETWGGMLSRLAASGLGVGWARRWPHPRPEWGVNELAFLRWATTAHAALVSPPPDLRELDAALLTRATLEPLPQTEPPLAAVLYQAVRAAAHDRLQSDLEAAWQVGRPAQDAVALVTRLCRRFPLFATQIGVRHAKRKTITFTDEYDVQDAMHALLRLFFDDVRAEEVSPSYAGSSSRIDFLLKREKVVVEVKMTRKSLKQKEVASQLIEDKERYRTHPDFRTLVCFVYDPGGFIANPAALEDDISQGAGEFRVVVIVAPKGS